MLYDVRPGTGRAVAKRVPLSLILRHHKNSEKDAARTKIFGLVRQYGAFPGIAMVSTNAQDTKGGALTLHLQDALCLVSFII